MSHPEGTSLLDFVDAPVIVGDPDTRVIYVNPSCERRLGITAAAARGDSMSSLFEGGSRESVLKAVAEVCAHGRTVRFKLREAGYDYLAQASPIEAEGDRVGVVILMTDEPPSERGQAVPPALAKALHETIACLQELSVEAFDPHQRETIERGLAGLGQLQKFVAEGSEARQTAQPGRSQSTLDPVRVARQVAQRTAGELASQGCDLDLLVPQQLPEALGEADGVEAALVEIIRHALQQDREKGHFTLSARVIGSPGLRSLIFSVVQLGASEDEDRGDAADMTPRSIRDQIEKSGGSLYSATRPKLGRVAAIQLQLASS